MTGGMLTYVNCIYNRMWSGYTHWGKIIAVSMVDMPITAVKLNAITAVKLNAITLWLGKKNNLKFFRFDLHVNDVEE